MSEDLISRQAAIDELKAMYHAAEKWGAEAMDEVIKARAESCMASLIEMKLRIEKISPADPGFDEWCTDCKEYDKEKHCCPRWNRVIRETLEESKPKTGRWIIKDNPGMGWYRVTCSECWEDVTSAVPIIGFLPNAKVIWDYCPYCGAKMEG